MMMKTGRTTPLHRVLAILLSLLMLLQSTSVFAEDITTPEAIPEAVQEVITETVSDDLAVPAENALAETVDTPNEDGKAPAEDAGTINGATGTPDEASGETGEPGETANGEENTGIPEETAAAPAAEPVIDTSESITMTEAGYVPAPPYFEGTLVHEGPDYTITVTIGTDAMFPEDVQMRVAEILPGTEQYELYNQMMEETLEEGEELGEFARYFDISFITVVDGVDTEIEPQADIDVQITFQETIALTEESDVQAIHIAENTPEILETITDSLEAAVNDDEAIDTVTFSADSFSIYGVVQKIKKILKVITASGATFTVDVTYTSDANIPEDAELIATEITPNDPNYNIYREQTALALGADDVKLPGLFDLGIYVNGEKIQPEAPVSVAISLNEGIQEDEKLYVVHFPEGIEAAKEPEPAEAEPKLMAAPRMMRAAAPMTQPAEEQATEQQTTEKQDTEATEPETKNETPAVATEVVSEVAVEGETVTFAANGFSVYALAYTVDFHYGDVEYSIPGGGALSLRMLLEVTGIVKNETEQNNASEEEVPAEETAEANENSASSTASMYDEAMDRFIANIERVEFSNPELVWIEKIEEDKTVGEIREAIGLNTAYSSELTKAEIAEINGTVIKAVDWVIISLKAFTTNETLRITMTDGTVYVIDVTDGQIRTYFISDGGDTYEIIVTYDDSANIPATATLKVRQVGFDEGKFIENVERVNAALEARGESSLGSPVLFEISIMDGENEIEPAEGSIIHVEVRLIHYANGEATEEISSVDNNDIVTETDEDAGTEERVFIINGEIFQIGTEPGEPVVAHIADNGNIEIIERVQCQAEDNWNIMQFDTESFSDYIFDGGNGSSLDNLPSTIYVGDEIYMWNQGNYWVNNLGSVVKETKHNNSDNHKTVTAINTGTFRIYYRYNQGIYKEIRVLPARNGTNPPNTIETVDNNDVGIKLNLFDYDLDNYLDDYFNNYNHNDNPVSNVFSERWGSINNGHNLKFWGSGIGDTYGAYNQYQSQGIERIVKNRLNSAGYPELRERGDSLQYLFEPNSGTDKKAYRDVNHLFKKEGDYYVYDSNVNYAYYDKDQGHGGDFVVYERTYEQKSNGDNAAQTNGKAIGFFPFHKWDEDYDLFVNWNKSLNHHFGLSMSVDFTMPKNPKAVEDSEGNPIVFEFSGDDDMWVFIDGQLVMDIGGVHQPVSGTINFKDKTVMVNGKTNNGGQHTSNQTDIFSDELYNSLFDGQKHTLQVFYLERGGCDSNCKIKFNLTQYGEVKFDKVDENTSNNLGGAVFGIYKDAACTQLLAEKWKTDGAFHSFVAESDANGHVQFSDIPLGDYYLKEIKAPVGYPLDPTVHTLKAYVDSSTGEVVVKTTIDGHLIVDENGQPIKITNKKPSPIDLNLKKEWQNAEGQEIEAPANLTAKFELKQIKTTEELTNPTVKEGGQTAHLTIRSRKSDGNSPRYVYESFDVARDSDLSISWEYNSDYTGQTGYRLLDGTGSANSYSNHVSNTTANIDFDMIDDSDDYDAIKNITISGKQLIGNKLYDFSRVTEIETKREVTLPEGDSTPWESTFENLPVTEATSSGGTIYYSYYLKEVDNPDWITVEYKVGNNAISAPINAATNVNGTTTTVTNKVDFGALELSKQVTVNEVATVTDPRIDETVSFRIEGIGETVTEGYSLAVDIHYVDGVADSYTVEPTGANVTVTNSTDDSNIWSILLADLLPGDYKITETGTGSLKLTGIIGGKGGTINATDKSVIVTVTPGKNTTETITDTARAQFTNNFETIDLPVNKTWGEGQAAPEGAEIELGLKATIPGTPTEEEPNPAAVEITPNLLENQEVTVTLNGGQKDDENQYTGDDTTDKPWEYTWTSLPKYDGNGNEITYSVEEKSYTIDGESLPVPENPFEYQGTDLEITNEIPTTDISAKKNWPDGQTVPEGTQITLGITAKLEDETQPYGVTVAPATVTLDGKVSEGVETEVETENTLWQYTWEDLPQYDKNGKKIVYTVEETGYMIGTIDYSALIPTAADDPVSEGFTFSYTNQLPVTEVTVNKTWGESGTDDWPDGISVVMTLKGSIPDGSGGTTELELVLPDIEEGEDTVEQTAEIELTSEKATHTWSELPMYTLAGQPIEYTVEETGMKFTAEGQTTAVDITNWEDVIESTSWTEDNPMINNQFPTTEIEVTKVWTVNGVPKEITDEDISSIGFNLYRTDAEDPLTLTDYTYAANKGEAEENKIKYVSGEEAGWQTVTISNLPKYELTVGTDGTAKYTAIEYYVTETGVAGDTSITYSSDSGDETATPDEAATNSGTITIYNRDADVDINVLKVDAKDDSKKLSGAEFQILKYKEADSEYAAYNLETNAYAQSGEESKSKLTTGEDGSLKFERLQAGKYKIVETKSPDGYYMPTNQDIYFEIDADGAVTWTDKDGNAITDSNKPNKVEYADTSKTFTVGNDAGTVLPSTGGTGTLPYILSGLFFIAMAGAILLMRKRKA